MKGHCSEAKKENPEDISMVGVNGKGSKRDIFSGDIKWKQTMPPFEAEPRAWGRMDLYYNCTSAPTFSLCWGGGWVQNEKEGDTFPTIHVIAW